MSDTKDKTKREAYFTENLFLERTCAFKTQELVCIRLQKPLPKILIMNKAQNSPYLILLHVSLCSAAVHRVAVSCMFIISQLNFHPNTSTDFNWDLVVADVFCFDCAVNKEFNLGSLQTVRVVRGSWMAQVFLSENVIYGRPVPRKYFFLFSLEEDFPTRLHLFSFF